MGFGGVPVPHSAWTRAITSLVHAAPGFHEHPKVLDGASELFNAVLGPRGRHARTALGINEMPLNAPVQLCLIAEVA